MINVQALIGEMEEQLALISEATGKDRDARIDGLRQYLKGLKQGIGVEEQPANV